MTGLRARVRLAPLGVAVAVVIASGVPVHAADRERAGRNPADRQFDRARQAVRDYDFTGSVRIWWRDARGGQATTVAVVARRGALHVAGGQVLHDGGRAWMRTDRRWTTLWGDPRDVRAPSLSPKYQVSTGPGPEVVHRPTRLLTVRRGGAAVEVVASDRETGLVLRRDRFDPSGAPNLRMEFVALTAPQPRQGRSDGPVVTPDAPGTRRVVPDDARRSLTGGFALVDAREMPDRTTQLRYSDGVFEASVFAQAGPIDWEALPAGGRAVRYGPVHARRYRVASGTVIVWESDDRTFTCVTDATAVDEAGIVADLSRERGDGWSSVMRFVGGPFRWS